MITDCCSTIVFHRFGRTEPHFAYGPHSRRLDATEAPRHILHAKLSIPAKPGAYAALSQVAARTWAHGPVTDLVNLRFGHQLWPGGGIS